ncbi:MAG: hypothetical protein ABW001_08395 [Mycobacterium sp.]
MRLGDAAATVLDGIIAGVLEDLEQRKVQTPLTKLCARFGDHPSTRYRNYGKRV